MKNLRKNIIYVSITVIALVLILFLVDSILKIKEQRAVNELVENNSDISVVEQEGRVFNISGEFTCLPLINTEAPHDDICLFGLKNFAGDYYQLQPDGDNGALLNALEIGQKLEVSGKYIAETSNIYQSLGVIKVSSIKFLKDEVEASGFNNSNLPSSFAAKYSSFQNYSLSIHAGESYVPSEFRIVDGEIDCEETTPTDSSLNLRLIKKDINGKKYCIGASSEGAAGSVYTEYAYATVINNNVYLTLFLARDVDCNNYPEEEKIECQAERESFNLDNLVDAEVEKIII